MQPDLTQPEVQIAPTQPAASLRPAARAAPPGRLSLSPGWLAFAALALAVPVSALLLTKAVRGPELPVLADLPGFSLTDQGGHPFGRAQLAGKVWIADFVFTSCADACPRLTEKMKRLQDRLIPPEQGGLVRLLSISVDPERDTPEKLRDYGKAFGAREDLWPFLTGSQLEVERTVVKGFHVAMAKMPLPKEGLTKEQTDNALQGEAFDIMHGERLVLVDKLGRIRGYYDADEPDKVLHDARALAQP